MTTTEVRVAHMGLGAIGREVVRLVLNRPGLDLREVCDISPDLVGSPLGTVLGQEVSQELIVTDCVGDAGGPTVLTHTTTSSLAACLPELLAGVEAGAHVVSSCEELSYPWLRAPEAAAKLDAAARAAGVAVVGTGVNPGFAMDYLPLVLSGATRSVEAVRVRRVQDAGQRRRPLQVKVGAGLTTEEFTRRVEAGSLGHVGLAESAQAIACALGWEAGSTTDVVKPVVAQRSTPSELGAIEPGAVAGIDQQVTVEADGFERVRLELVMAVGVGPSQDDIWLTGDPDLRLTVPGGLHGDLATAAVIVNTIGSICEARPGLRVMSELRPPRPH